MGSKIKPIEGWSALWRSLDQARSRILDAQRLWPNQPFPHRSQPLDLQERTSVIEARVPRGSQRASFLSTATARDLHGPVMGIAMEAPGLASMISVSAQRKEPLSILDDLIPTRLHPTERIVSCRTTRWRGPATIYSTGAIVTSAHLGTSRSSPARLSWRCLADQGGTTARRARLCTV